MLFYQKNFNLNCTRTEIKTAFNFCTRIEIKSTFNYREDENE